MLNSVPAKEVTRARAMGWHRSALVGLGAAILMFCLGFGAMFLFWNSGLYSDVEPGFFYYYAATWGDGLFLSVGAGGLAGWLHRHRDDEVKRWGVVVAIALVCCAVGIATQASWLISDDTKTNWTIPAQHYFNAPGWYHAAFFVAAFTFFGYAFSAYCAKRFRLLSPNASAEENSTAHHGGSFDPFCELTIWFAVSGYLAMHFHDDRPSLLETPLGVFVPGLAVLVVAVVALVVWRVMQERRGLDEWQRRDWHLSLSAVTASQALSMGVVSIIIGVVPSWPAEWACVGGLVLVSAAAIAVDEYAFSWRVACVAMAGFGVALSIIQLHWVAGQATGNDLGVVVSTTATFGLYVASVWLCQVDHSPGIGNRPARGALLFAVIAVFAIVYICGFGDKNDMETLLYSFALVIAAYYAKLTVSPVQEAERREREAPGTGDRDAVRNRTYGILGAVIIGMLGMFILQIASEYRVEADGWQLLGLFADTVASVWVALPILVVSIVGIAVLGKAMKGRSMGGGVQAALLAVSFLTVLAVEVTCKDWLPLSAELVICYVLAVVLSCGMAAFMVESYISNTALIRTLPRKHDGRLMAEAAIIFVGTALVCFASIVPTATVADPSWKVIVSTVPGFIGLPVGFVLLPYLMAKWSVWRGYDKPMAVYAAEQNKTGDVGARVDKDESAPSYLIQNTPQGGVVQSGFAALVVGLLFGIFALQMFMCFSVLSGFLTFLAAVLTAYAVMRFPFENNRKFLRDSIEQAKAGKALDSDPNDTLRRLSRHLQRQPLFASVGLLPWSLLYWASAIVKSDEPVSERLRRELLLRWGPRKDIRALVMELFPSRASEVDLADVADQVLHELGWNEGKAR